MGGLVMKKSLLGNTLLAGVVGVFCLASMLLRAFAPAVILPVLDLPMLVLLSLIALTMERYLEPNQSRPWGWTVLLSGAVFAFLPWCAGLTEGETIWKLFLAGAAVYGGGTFLYGSMFRRLAATPASRLAPAMSAFALFLACQALAGLF